MTPTKFMPNLPCYSIFDPDTKGPHTIPHAGSKAIVVLTDSDLLARYRDESEQEGVAFLFDDFLRMTKFLDSYRDIEYLAFDPSGHRT